MTISSRSHTGPPDTGVDPDGRRPGGVRPVWFWLLWTATTVVGAGVVAVSQDIGEPSSLKAALPMVPLLALTIMLLRRLGPDRLPAAAGAALTARSRLTVLVLAAVVPLIAVGFLGPALLVPLTVAAGVGVAVWRHDVRRGEVPVALGFAVVATAGGSANWLATGDVGDLAFAGLMLPLATLSLLAGWAAGRRAGWEGTPVGRTLVLAEGWGAAARDVAFGALVSIPWSLGNIANGPGDGDPMDTWWQPVSTLMPGVAEEAWARVLLISVLFLLFRRAATASTALLTAALVATYWFAFIHMTGDPVGALLLGTIFVLPMTYLYLRRSLEAAIGFHLCANLVNFTAAYLVTADVWFR